MIGGLVEIADEGRHLCVYRGFLKVLDGHEELGRVPLDDIDTLILSGTQITLTKALIAELAVRKATIVTCGQNWHPVSMSLPYGIHYRAAGILQDQIDASKPLKKRLWQQIVQAKIDNQAKALQCFAPESKMIHQLKMLRKGVRSGDPKNLEAQAARRYWRALMGHEFRRDRRAEDANIYLNYGYTVLRAATARAVCGSGLHPALGIHHRSRINPFALVDDLMEPYRPLVDLVARNISDHGAELGPGQKRSLAAVLKEEMILENKITPAVNGLAKLAQSLVTSLTQKMPLLAIATIQVERTRGAS